MRLAGRVTIIGGSRGMGAFEAGLFDKEGAKVVDESLGLPAKRYIHGLSQKNIHPDVCSVVINF